MSNHLGLSLAEFQILRARIASEQFAMRQKTISDARNTLMLAPVMNTQGSILEEFSRGIEDLNRVDLIKDAITHTNELLLALGFDSPELYEQHAATDTGDTSPRLSVDPAEELLAEATARVDPRDLPGIPIGFIDGTMADEDFFKKD